MVQDQISVVRDRVTPFLKWAGGKRWLVANHAHIFPSDFNRYIEPFLGSAAVYFHLQPRDALLADVNPELINAYSVIKSRWRMLEAALEVHQSKHSDKYYYSMRKEQPTGSVDRAARFIYLNRTCWNGLYRVNKKGEFNVPRGTKDSVQLKSDDFSVISKLLKFARLQVADFEESIDSAVKDDLIFVDPPYTVKHNHNGFIKYNDKIFSWEDQIRLRDALLRAKKRGAYIVMTNANHMSVRELYKDFDSRSLFRQSVLSGLAEARGGTEELLVTNV